MLHHEHSALPFHPRGPLSDRLMTYVAGGAADDHDILLAATDAAASADIVRDDDAQLSLFFLYSLAYGSFGGFGADFEWDPALLAARTRLEAAFEAALRREVEPPAGATAERESIAATLFAMTAPAPGPSLSRFVEKKATLEQVQELLMQRSIYTLREADTHSWAIPRLTGKAKAALVEIQADEYGGGRPERMHATLFAQAMRGAGLDDSYGVYLDAVPAITLASLNMMSMFGLNRRLVGAIVGHLAAFEMTSSLPNRRYADGMRRVGLPDTVTEYFDEHVEADAVHEQIAGHDMAGNLGQEHPELLDDILFGAAACLAVDGWAGDHILDAWQAGRSSLRDAALVAAMG